MITRCSRFTFLPPSPVACKEKEVLSKKWAPNKLKTGKYKFRKSSLISVLWLLCLKKSCQWKSEIGEYQHVIFEELMIVRVCLIKLRPVLNTCRGCTAFWSISVIISIISEASYKFSSVEFIKIGTQVLYLHEKITIKGCKWTGIRQNRVSPCRFSSLAQQRAFLKLL